MAVLFEPCVACELEIPKMPWLRVCRAVCPISPILDPQGLLAAHGSTRETIELIVIQAVVARLSCKPFRVVPNRGTVHFAHVVGDRSTRPYNAG